MIVVIEAIFAVVGNVDIGPAIVVVITYRDAESPALIRHSGFSSNIGESSVVIVVQEHGLRRRFFAL